MKMKIIMAIWIAALMSACGSGNQGAVCELNCGTPPPPPQVYVGVLSDEEYAVYSDIISSQTKEILEMYHQLSATANMKAADLQYVLQDVVGVAMGDWTKQSLEEAHIDATIINDLFSREEASIDVSQLNPDVVPQMILFTDVVAADFPKNDPDEFWNVFENKYPTAYGLYSFSRIGFNAAKDNAVLIVNYSCGSLCGTGHWKLFEKKDGHWVFVKSEMLWIS